MNEAEFLRQVLELCAEHDVLVFHSTDSRRDVGKGFPDLVLVGHHQIVFAELKAGDGYRKPEQTTWYYRLLVTGSQCYLWHPQDMPAISRLLAQI